MVYKCDEKQTFVAESINAGREYAVDFRNISRIKKTMYHDPRRHNCGVCRQTNPVGLSSSFLDSI